ncbi:hypothetical protein F4775DRAFT_572847 [Biscogniauxia sp. FL1348]|nr:hypothetical protein F4775DRAFT_572847 [Biscogniauxia sp. FL1348]
MFYTHTCTRRYPRFSSIMLYLPTYVLLSIPCMRFQYLHNLESAFINVITCNHPACIFFSFTFIILKVRNFLVFAQFKEKERKKKK